MPDWIRKANTTAHPLEAVLRDKNGPVDLPVDTTVVFRAKVPGALVPKINAAGTVVSPGAEVDDPDRGLVSYSPTTDDLDTPGIYEVDIFATIPGLGTQPFPEDGYLYLLVLESADLT